MFNHGPCTWCTVQCRLGNKDPQKIQSDLLIFYNGSIPNSISIPNPAQQLKTGNKSEAEVFWAFFIGPNAYLSKYSVSSRVHAECEIPRCDAF